MTNSLQKINLVIFFHGDYQHVDREKYLQIQTPQICNFSKLKDTRNACMKRSIFHPMKVR